MSRKQEINIDTKIIDATIALELTKQCKSLEGFVNVGYGKNNDRRCLTVLFETSKNSEKASLFLPDTFGGYEVLTCYDPSEKKNVSSKMKKKGKK